MQKCEDIVTGEPKYISCGPAPSDIEEENMVLKTLQMLRLIMTSPLIAFGASFLKAGNSNKNA